MIIIMIKVVNQQQASTMTVSKPTKTTVWQLFQCSICRYEPFIYFILDLNLEYTPKQIIVLDIIVKVHLNILTEMALSGNKMDS